jgi:hypothetical protein
MGQKVCWADKIVKMIHLDDSYHLFLAYDALADGALRVQLVYMTDVAEIVEGSAMHQTQCKKRDKTRQNCMQKSNNYFRFLGR